MMVAAPFNDEQKRYLEGFVSGLQTSRAAAGLKPVGAQPSSLSAEPPVAGPDQPHHAAMARFEREGRKLSNEEKVKRDDNPLDAYARLKTEAETGKFPKGVDNFRWRYHGLFYVAPAQDAFMCRLRIPNGILTHWQFAHVADLARRYDGGYTHVTTRANLQIREIAATGGPALVEGLADAGLTPKGSGADNIRNVTGSATAGIDPAELLDTRPFAREWHHHILNTRTLYGLPRKFNVAFGGGGAIPTLEETNDIAFTAVQVAAGSDGKPEVWFRLALGGITGRRDFARPAGVFVKPAEATRVADAIVRVFIDHGDRTDRKKARLKYVLDTWGFEKFIAAVEEKLGALLPRFADGQVRLPSGKNRLAHIGAHAQRQEGKVWVGVVLPAGKLTCDQMQGLARLSHEMGDGDIRLTVWQNLLISGVDATSYDACEARLQAMGLTSKATNVRAGLIACTGAPNCKFGAANTKGTAEALAAYIEPRLTLDTPINIHLTGCHHSCAQHYIGDIGMIACKVPVAGSDDVTDGFDILAGGGFGLDAAIASDLFTAVKVEDCPALVLSILQTYAAHRTSDQETFADFSRRLGSEKLKNLVLTQEACE